MAPKKNKNLGSQKEYIFFFEKMSKTKSLFFGLVSQLIWHGSMRKTLEMITVLRMQNMVEIRKKNTYFVTILLFGILKFEKISD